MEKLFYNFASVIQAVLMTQMNKFTLSITTGLKPKKYIKNGLDVI